MASPSMTFPGEGNVRASASLLAGNTTTIDEDYSTKFETLIQVKATFGTVSATAGLQVDAFAKMGTAPTYDTIGQPSFVITAVGSTTVTQTFRLPPGKYRLSFKNLDATNALTDLTVTSATVDGIA